MRALLRTLLLPLVLGWSAGPAAALELGARSGTLFAPFLEWALENPSFAGNPYDLPATARFVHGASGETRTTGMFYDGGSTWRFRFTATRTGRWTLSTESADPELDGHTGWVDVEPNPDPGIRGFLVADGTRFARTRGDDRPPTGYLLHVFQDEVDLRTSAIFGPRPGLSAWADPALTQALLDQIEANGFDTMEIELEHQVFQIDAARYTEHSSSDPDRQSFGIVEDMLVAAHARGHTVRLFMWGDEARKMTPVGLPGGINGEVDRRMQRYLAARLGPLPAWTLTYGFDLEEWVSEAQVRDWAAYLHAELGWPHLLSARRRFDAEIDLAANDDRPTGAFYANAESRLASSGGRPVVFERRFIHLRDGVWDMDTTRRALWQFTLAGGAGAVWGRDQTPYPAPEQLRTHLEFWQGRDRFQPGLAPANALTDGWALGDAAAHRYVFYGEDVSSLRLDLSGAPGPLRALAVDTRAVYAELDLGLLPPLDQSASLPYASDWAIAVAPPAGPALPALPGAARIALAGALLLLALLGATRISGRA